MKITLITASPEMKEIDRIKEECLNAGHEFNLVNFNEFKYIKKSDGLHFYPEIPDTDVAILRALFPTMGSLEPLNDYLKKRKIKMFDNNLLTHKYSMNKSYDLFKLILADINVPDTFSARTYKDLYELKDALGFPLVVKSSKSGQGARVWLTHDYDEYKDFISKFEQKLYPARNIIVQGFVDYKYDLRILVLGEDMYCMRRIPKEGDFRANFSLGGSVELFPLTPELRDLARKAISTIGLELAGVDVLIDKSDKKYILEVNHTPGMLGMEAATGDNITKKYLDYAIAHAK
jgi:gamma-F420-2:alpha-L-glutamate ligase